MTLLVGCACCSADDSISPTEIFDQRILPIFRSPDPSSCVQCHLSSVDLKDYILPSAEATFVSLREQGLIDLDEPARSKILELISMGEKDLDEGAKLIHAEKRDAELLAFRKWIEACCSDAALRSLPAARTLAKPDVSHEVIRHARKSRVVDSFVRHVWSQRMRCFPCHTPNEIDPENPRHKRAIEQQQKFAEQYDDEMLQRLAIFRETPEATLDWLVERSRENKDDRLPLLNLDEPAKSLMVLKPTSKLPAKNEDGSFQAPAYREPVSHMGGLKMHPNDHSYKAFIAWIQDYANVTRGSYRNVSDLPADNWHPTKMALRIKQAPSSWEVGTTVQLFVHGWDADADRWHVQPLAFTQGTVTPRRMVNGLLFLLEPGIENWLAKPWSVETRLPRGRYLVKAFVDSERRVVDDATAMLSEDDYYGAAELAKARWRHGFPFAEVLQGDTIRRAEGVH